MLPTIFCRHAIERRDPKNWRKLEFLSFGSRQQPHFGIGARRLTPQFCSKLIRNKRSLQKCSSSSTMSVFSSSAARADRRAAAASGEQRATSDDSRCPSGANIWRFRPAQQRGDRAHTGGSIEASSLELETTYELTTIAIVFARARAFRRVATSEAKKFC